MNLMVLLTEVTAEQERKAKYDFMNLKRKSLCNKVPENTTSD